MVGVAVMWSRKAPPAVARAHWVMLEALALAVAIGPLVGWMVDLVGFTIVFSVISVLVAVGGLWTFRLAEPRHRL